MAVTVTMRMLAVNRLMQRACTINGHAPLTLKHRALLGANTNTVAGASTNTRLRAKSGHQTLEATTDSKVWVTWIPIKVRGGSQDGGDTAAGQQFIARFYGQCSALDINNNPLTIIDGDWFVTPDNNLMEIENPIVSPDGSTYTFAGVQQR